MARTKQRARKSRTKRTSRKEVAPKVLRNPAPCPPEVRHRDLPGTVALKEEASEAYVVELPEIANIFATHPKRATIMRNDVELARRIRVHRKYFFSVANHVLAHISSHSLSLLRIMAWCPFSIFDGRLCGFAAQ
uniref:Histone domain-containing protein n=1 Tax=Angiostrongylus cantonensis TaxID=6313 RepID=A0A0K0D4Z2_ANGCA